MFQRMLKTPLSQSLRKYKCVSLIGPRQSGKTTLAKICASDFDYISLENPDSRSRAISDPRLFLKSCKNSAILDEIQYVPELFSYLQEILDDKKDKRQFILTGSNSFQLNEKVSQSLASRTRIFKLLPLTLSELPEQIDDLDKLLTTGFYPRIYDEKLDPFDWFSDYYQTYIQKDINLILNVSDTNQFDRFVRVCAGRASQLTEYSSIASEIGISQPTAVRWASVLESSFITFRLSPHFNNYNKKIIKSSKLFFFDTGLLCQLLRIRTPEILETHPLRGAVFENFVVSEIMKQYLSNAQDPPLYFWRDQHGHEIDLVQDKSTKLACFEIKSGSTFQEDWIKNLTWFKRISNSKNLNLIYGGEDEFSIKDVKVFPWQKINNALSF